MKKAIVIIISLFLYIIFYKTYLIFNGEIAVYIINPLIWFVLGVISHVFLHNKRRDYVKHKATVLPVMVITSLAYVTFYYGFGLILGYTNNPYSTVASGLVINLFSVLFVTCIKEYIRYTLLQVNIKRYKKTYYVALLLVFILSDINFLNLITSQNILGIIAKELPIPIIINLFMTYLAYVSTYKGPIISRVIMILPSLLFNVVPDYDWFIITVFNSLYCLLSYLILHYVIAKKDRNIVGKLSIHFHPLRWIVVGSFVSLVVAFATGLLPIKPVVILTGSMRPIINPGDMSLIRKCDIDEATVGDVIAYRIANYTVVHRIISIYNYLGDIHLITKGDANKEADKNPVSSEQFIGKLQYNIPYVGYPTYVLRNIVYNNKEAPSH